MLCLHCVILSLRTTELGRQLVDQDSEKAELLTKPDRRGRNRNNRKYNRLGAKFRLPRNTPKQHHVNLFACKNIEREMWYVYNVFLKQYID